MGSETVPNPLKAPPKPKAAGTPDSNPVLKTTLWPRRTAAAMRQPASKSAFRSGSGGLMEKLSPLVATSAMATSNNQRDLLTGAVHAFNQDALDISRL